MNYIKLKQRLDESWRIHLSVYPSLNSYGKRVTRKKMIKIEKLIRNINNFLNVNKSRSDSEGK